MVDAAEAAFFLKAFWGPRKVFGISIEDRIHSVLLLRKSAPL
jgi:hypothetical protein